MTVVPLFPALTMFVATMSIWTTEDRVNLKCTIASSRKPSPFGLTVVRSRRSPAKGVGPIVTGDDFPPIERDENTTTWRGAKVRFRIIGGTFRVRVKGSGVNLSFVGKATVTLNGFGTDDDGTYSANGDTY